MKAIPESDRAQVLLVEDEEALRVGLRDKLELEGFRVDATPNGEDALSRTKVKEYDLVLLDVVLPGMSGLEVLRRFREKEAKDGAGRRTPVILLTARAHESDKVLGLELGADDYVTKPFGVRELVARVRAHLRRERAHKGDDSENAPPPAPPGYRFGECEVDFEGYKLHRKKKEVRLSNLEWKILALLVREKGRTVTRERFLREIWGYERLPITRTVDFHVSRLRQKVDEPKDPRHILTVHGIGYRFEE